MLKGENFGFAIPDNMIVLDIDPRNGGVESYRALLESTGLPKLDSVYPTVKTMSGGFHYYMSLKPNCDPRRYGNNKYYPGIDIKRAGGYVVAAGSKIFGKAYTVVNDPTRCAYAYPRLLSQFLKALPVAPPSEAPIITSEELAKYLKCLDPRKYSNNDLWFPILCAAYNATGGAGLDEFIYWSTQDPKYAKSAGDIRARWHSLKDVPNKITLATIIREIPQELRPSTISKDFGDSSIFQTKEAHTYIDAVTAELNKTHDNISDLAYTVAQLTAQTYRLIHGADSRYWIYEKTHWRPIGNNFVSSLILNTYREMGETKAVSPVLNAAETILRAMVAIDKVPGQILLDSGYSVINVQNGELWIDDRTGKTAFKRHNPESYLSFCLPIEYNKEATCPRFDLALSQIFEGNSDIVNHLWNLFGYTIQMRKNIATWVLFLGRGSNGKSLILDILSALLGPAALPLQIEDLERDSHALAQLPGKLAIIDDDVKAQITLPDNVLKKISENKFLTANPKFATPFSFLQTAIPWLAANTMPRIVDLSDGLKRRAQVFKFNVIFTEDTRDNNLRATIVDNELSGVLNRALFGLRSLRKRGHFKTPDECTDIKELWYGASDPIYNYVKDRLIKLSGPIYATPFNHVWDDYQKFAYDAGMRRPLTKFQFIAALNNCGVSVSKHPVNGRYFMYKYRVRQKGKAQVKSSDIGKHCKPLANPFDKKVNPAIDASIPAFRVHPSKPKKPKPLIIYDRA